MTLTDILDGCSQFFQAEDLASILFSAIAFTGLIKLQPYPVVHVLFDWRQIALAHVTPADDLVAGHSVGIFWRLQASSLRMRMRDLLLRIWVQPSLWIGGVLSYCRLEVSVGVLEEVSLLSHIFSSLSEEATSEKKEYDNPRKFIASFTYPLE